MKPKDEYGFVEAIRCDVCGRWVSGEDIFTGRATHRLITPDSDRSRETWETLCKDHKDT